MYVLINLVVNLWNEDFHWLCFVGRGLLLMVVYICVLMGM